MIAPDMIASMAARCTARVGSPRASGATIAAMTAANDESGPRTMTRDGPKMAYTRSGTMVA